MDAHTSEGSLREFVVSIPHTVPEDGSQAGKHLYPLSHFDSPWFIFETWSHPITYSNWPGVHFRLLRARRVGI